MTIITNGKTNTQIFRSEDHWLNGIQRQVRFLMRQHLQQRSCPNCGHLSNLPEAAGIEIDEFNFGSHGGDRIGPCPRCRRTLIYTLPWPTGIWRWRLDPQEAQRT